MHNTMMSSEEQSRYEYDKAPSTVGRYLAECGIDGKSVIDFGCGWGGETAWLCDNGASRVFGIDIDEDALGQARLFAGQRHVEFLSDIRKIPDDSVDVVFSTDVFEHVMDLNQTLDELHRVLKPGGALISRFGPLFYSPYGCHFYWAKLYPWGHLLFGRRWLLKRIARVRGYGSTSESWEELGLNRVTYTNFAGLVRARFNVVRLQPIAVSRLPLVCRIPVVRRFLTFGCDMHVVK